MAFSRRRFLHQSAVSIGAITVMPQLGLAEGQGGDRFETSLGDIVVHPVAHASIILETPAGTIYVDPVGPASDYQGQLAPDLILITHEHGDHYNADTLNALVQPQTKLITNPAVFKSLPSGLAASATMIANDQSTSFGDVAINAIGAYNLTEDRLRFHPKGRDNGYILDFGGYRIYVSGDTEDVPEMRALKDIDLAFVCMNLPFTMDAKAAADAVAEFRPKVVYPYHYRGRGDGTQDPEEFARLVAEASDVRFGDWY